MMMVQVESVWSDGRTEPVQDKGRAESAKDGD